MSEYRNDINRVSELYFQNMRSCVLLPFLEVLYSGIVPDSEKNKMLNLFFMVEIFIPMNKFRYEVRRTTGKEDIDQKSQDMQVNSNRILSIIYVEIKALLADPNARIELQEKVGRFVDIYKQIADLEIIGRRS